MEKQIINLYVEQGKSITDIARKLKISVDEVYSILNSEHYMASKGRKKEWILKAKKAIDFYIENPSYTSNKVANMFEITQESLSKSLKELGIDISERTKLKFDEHIFDVIDTEEKAYWLGFIFADGNISSSPIDDEIKQKHYIFSFCLALIDTGHLFKFDKFMNVEKSKVKVYDYIDYDHNPKQHTKWIIANKHLWNTLNNLGCTPRKSLTLKYPNIPDHLKKHFARGYFDGDGSFGVYNNKGYGELNLSCVGTEDMMTKLFNQLDLNITMYHHKGHSEETKTINANSQKAKEILDYMYKDATIYLDRKFNKYLEVCRFWEKLQKLRKGKNGEGCDANTVLNSEITQGSESV